MEAPTQVWGGLQQGGRLRAGEGTAVGCSLAGVDAGWLSVKQLECLNALLQS